MDEYISPQVKILRVLFMNGGSAKTKVIQESTGMYAEQVFSSGRHLVNRSIVTKKKIMPTSNPNTYYCVWSIRPQKLEKALRMVQEKFPGEKYEIST